MHWREKSSGRRQGKPMSKRDTSKLKTINSSELDAYRTAIYGRESKQVDVVGKPRTAEEVRKDEKVAADKPKKKHKKDKKHGQKK